MGGGDLVTRFDRYVLSQLLMLFGLSSLILVLIYWVNRAVLLFDQLIANGQSAGVFAELTLLTLPNVIRMVLPIAAFAAALYVANRLVSESELVVARASGQSPWRMMRPVFLFGAIVATMVAMLTHFLVPLSVAELNARQGEINENITARLLNEGRFLHPSDGFTFYIREISPSGELRHVFVNDRTNPEAYVTYTARQAFLLRGETGPTLVMFDGLAQTYDQEDQRLAVTRFRDFTFDISTLVGRAPMLTRSYKEVATGDLLAAGDTLLDELGRPLGVLLYEAHNRTAQALLSIVAVTVGFATMLIGGFSRLGLWRQIIGAIVAIILLKSFDNAMADLARSDPDAWFAAYGAALTGGVLTAVLLWIAAAPTRLFARRVRA